MKALIIENEIYLAQSLCAKMEAKGFDCDIKSSYNEVNSIKEEEIKEYETVLLSTNFTTNETTHIIKTFHEKSIIILLVSYVSSATVSDPIKYGASDYVVKPFAVDELLKKIIHYKEFNELKRKSNIFDSYLNFTYKDINSSSVKIPDKFPFVIKTNSSKCAKKIMLQIADEEEIEVNFVYLKETSEIEKIRFESNKLYLLSGVDNFRNISKMLLSEKVKNKNVVICTNEEYDFGYETIAFDCEQNPNDRSEIMTINEYVKHTVLKFQSSYPDTELSKKLGISRKSLWEKRKKLDIVK
jgi:DNA-binding NtrC family response regulator